MSDDGYDRDDDFARSLDECYRVIRERMARGGPGWEPKMTALTPRRDTAVISAEATMVSAKIHVFDKAAEIAMRIKDPVALEKALLGKLEAQRDFAQLYQEMFPHGGDRSK